MHIFVVLLLASLMCCTNAAESRKIPGGEIEQNPNNPKYQKMAEEIVYYHMRWKKRNVKKVSVLKVTTQVVAGTKTRIKFSVLFYTGKTETCNSETLEQPWKQIKHVTFTCAPRSPQGSSEYPGGSEKNTWHGDKAKFHKLGKASVEAYLKKEFGNDKIDHLEVINVTYVTTRVYKQTIMYMNIDVFLQSSRKALCSALYGLPLYNTISIKCFIVKHVPGGYEWMDPSIAKYVDLAEKSLLSSSSLKLKLSLRGHDTIVTFVLRQVVEGYKYAIDFIIHPVDDNEYKCVSHVWEQLTGHELITDVDCRLNTNGSDYDLTKYERLGEAAVRDYIKNQPNKEHHIKDIEIKNTVYETTRVYQKKILYINYDAIMSPTLNNTCSVVFDIPSDSPLNTKCYEHRKDWVGQAWTDPSQKMYLDAAEKAGVFSKQTHDTIVTFVIYGTTLGQSADIDFIARPVDGGEYDCTTTVLQVLFPKTTTVKDVSCRRRKNSSNDLPSNDSSDL